MVFVLLVTTVIRLKKGIFPVRCEFQSLYLEQFNFRVRKISQMVSLRRRRLPSKSEKWFWYWKLSRSVKASA